MELCYSGKLCISHRMVARRAGVLQQSDFSVITESNGVPHMVKNYPVIAIAMETTKLMVKG